METSALRNPNRRRRNVQPLERFGDIVALDHVNANSRMHNGQSGETDVLCRLRLGHGVHMSLHGCAQHARESPNPPHTSLDTVDHTGSTRTGSGVDRGDTGISRRYLTASHEHSRGVPVKQNIRGVRTFLLQAGLPHVGWPYTPRCFAANHNFVEDRDGSPKGAPPGGCLFGSADPRRSIASCHAQRPS